MAQEYDEDVSSARLNKVSDKNNSEENDCRGAGPSNCCRTEGILASNVCGPRTDCDDMRITSDSHCSSQRHCGKSAKKKKPTKHHRQQTQEEGRMSLSGWRRKLNACRSPSTESIADLPPDRAEGEQITSMTVIGSAENTTNHSQARFHRSSSTGNANSETVVADWPTDDGEDTVVIPVILTSTNPTHSPFPMRQATNQGPGYSRNVVTSATAAPMAPYGQNTLPQAQAAAGGSVRNLRNSPFCPCLSPNDSDDEGTMLRESVNSSTHNRRQLGARQLISIARELRTRFALAADATNQPTPGPVASVAQNLGDGLMVAQPYPVHSSVAYTHYLVPELYKITMAPYYWGVMDRFVAEKLLDGKPEGTFLLRDSAQIEYLFSVSFRRYSRTLHARIEQLNHRFSFDSYDTGVFSAATVTELIEHYKDPARCLLFEPQLSKPLNRTFVFPLQHICRAVVSDCLQYDGIQNLPVPKKFKDYLREYHCRQPVRVRNLEGNS